MLFMSGQVVVNPYQRLFYFPEGACPIIIFQ